MTIGQLNTPYKWISSTLKNELYVLSILKDRFLPSSQWVEKNFFLNQIFNLKYSISYFYKKIHFFVSLFPLIIVAKYIARLLGELGRYLFFISLVYDNDNRLFITTVLIITLFKFVSWESLFKKDLLAWDIHVKHYVWNFDISKMSIIFHKR